MSNDLNQCQFIGRLGNDPECKYMPSGKMVVNISLAVGSKWKDKQSGQTQEHTEWVRCNAFDKLAEVMQQYLKKGSKVYVSGSWRTRKWQDQSGADRYTTELKINQMQMLDSRADSAGGHPQPAAAPQQMAPQPAQPQAPWQQPVQASLAQNLQQPAHNYQQPAPAQQPPQPQGNPSQVPVGNPRFDNFDDDIPF